MDKVTQQIWLTDISNVMTEDVGHVDLVLTVCEDNIGDLVSCDYKHFGLPSASGGLRGDFPSDEDFTQAADTLYEALSDGKTVLVHCHSGTSRSVAVSAAALARYEQTDFEDALETIEEVRPAADPSELYRDYGQQYVSAHCPCPY